MKNERQGARLKAENNNRPSRKTDGPTQRSLSQARRRIAMRAAAAASSVERNASAQRERRPVVLKVARTDVSNEHGKAVNDVVVVERFKTGASDSELQLWVESEIQKLKELDSLPEQSDGEKRFAIYIKDLDEGKECRPVIVKTLGTVESWRQGMVAALNEAFEFQKTYAYQHMIAYVEKKGWYFGELTREQKREVCAAIHPLFMSDEWNEDQRSKFLATSFQSNRR